MKDKHYIYLIDYSGCTSLENGLVKVGITKERSIETRFTQNFSSFRKYMNKTLQELTNDDIDCIYYRTPSAEMSSMQARYIEEVISLEFEKLKLPEKETPTGYTEIYNKNDRQAIQHTIENLILMFDGNGKNIDEFKHLYLIPKREINQGIIDGRKISENGKGHKRLNWRVSKKLADRLKHHAKEEGVSLNLFINNALEQCLKEERK